MRELAARCWASSSVSAQMAVTATASWGETRRWESLKRERYSATIGAPPGLMKSANA